MSEILDEIQALPNGSQIYRCAFQVNSVREGDNRVILPLGDPNCHRRDAGAGRFPRQGWVRHRITLTLS